VVERGKMFGSWGSEPAVSLSRTFTMETVIRAGDDGWLVDGVKHFCTMALGASYYMVWCALDGSGDMANALLLAVIPAESPGIFTDGKWDTLGMRATFSPSVTLSGVRITKDATLASRAQPPAWAWWKASPSVTPPSTWASRRRPSSSLPTT
jgi:alkylation response protein AidB-like acyl-CoA dehydrogenase